jgi:hypothetical protein
MTSRKQKGRAVVDDELSWEIRLEGDRALRVDRDGKCILVWQPKSEARPISLTGPEALALAEALRRQAELLRPERH